MRSQVNKAVNIKTSVFWDVTLCRNWLTFNRSLLPPSSGRWVSRARKIRWRFYSPDDGGSMHLWNEAQFERGCTAKHTRTHSTSLASPLCTTFDQVDSSIRVTPPKRMKYRSWMHAMTCWGRSTELVYGKRKWRVVWRRTALNWTVHDVILCHNVFIEIKLPWQRMWTYTRLHGSVSK
jgi:hypothetical protein